MARLVRHHPQQFVGVLGAQDQAGVDAHDPPTRGEGVQLVVIDQKNFDVGRVQPHGDEDRIDPFADDALDLGVADQALGRGLAGGDEGCEAHRRRGQNTRCGTGKPRHGVLQ